MVGDEGLGSGTTGNCVHHGCFDFQEVALVKEGAHVGDDLGANGELVADKVVHDQVEVTLTESELHVLETVVGLGQHAKTGRQESDLLGEDGELATLGLAGNTGDTDNITTSQEVVDLRIVVALVVLQRSHDLDLDTLAVQIVESQLGTRGTLVVNTASDGDDLVVKALVDVKAVELFNEVGKTHVDMELVRIRLRTGVFTELVDGLGTQLKVLLVAHT